MWGGFLVPPAGQRWTGVPCAGLHFGTELVTGTSEGVKQSTELVTGDTARMFGRRHPADTSV
jgi:hypothetical protein